MDQEHILNSFGEIEKQIDMLMDTCNRQEETIRNLHTRINELESALEAKRDLETHYMQEKDVVKQKIDGLLNKLEDFVTQPR